MQFSITKLFVRLLSLLCDHKATKLKQVLPDTLPRWWSWRLNMDQAWLLFLTRFAQVLAGNNQMLLKTMECFLTPFRVEADISVKWFSYELYRLKNKWMSQNVYSLIFILFNMYNSFTPHTNIILTKHLAISGSAAIVLPCNFHKYFMPYYFDMETKQQHKKIFMHIWLEDC